MTRRWSDLVPSDLVPDVFDPGARTEPAAPSRSARRRVRGGRRRVLALTSVVISAKNQDEPGTAKLEMAGAIGSPTVGSGTRTERTRRE